MKGSKGIVLLNSLLLILALLIVFYLLGFFLSFEVGNFKGISLAFLWLFITLTVFSLGVYVIPISPPSYKKVILQNLSLLALLLSTLTLITSAGTAAFRIVCLVIFPVLIFHLLILAVPMAQFLRQRKILSPPGGTIAPLERRKHPRIRDHVTAQYSLGDQKWHDAGVYDISAGGVRLIMEKELNPGQLIELRLCIPQDSRPIFAKGVVIWHKEFSSAKKMFYVGIKFVKIDSADSLRLTLKQAYSLFEKKD